MRLTALRRDLVEAAGELAARGLGPLAQASLSVRDRRTGWWVLTPAGWSAGDLAARDLVMLSAAGEVLDGGAEPDEAWRVHQRVYAGVSEADAIIVARPDLAAALAADDRDLPPFHPHVRLLGGGLRMVPYAPAGTEALSRLVADALRNRSACLVSHGGVVVRGQSAREAVLALALVERLAGAYAAYLAAGGEPPAIDSDDPITAAGDGAE